jgi:hypothetical protein
VTTDVRTEIGRNMTRTIDLDIDIGADAVDYKYVPLRATLFARLVHLPPPAPSPIKSLSRESRQRCGNWKDSSKRSWTSWTISRNGKRDSPTRIVRPLSLIRPHPTHPMLTCLLDQSRRTSACKTLLGSHSFLSWVWVYGRFSTSAPSLNASTSLTEQCYNILS